MGKDKKYIKFKKKYKKKYKKKEQKKLKSLMISTNNIVDNLNLIYAKIEQLKKGLDSEKKQPNSLQIVASSYSKFLSAMSCYCKEERSAHFADFTDFSSYTISA